MRKRFSPTEVSTFLLAGTPYHGEYVLTVELVFSVDTPRGLRYSVE